jgi:hypothetical protein
MEDIFMSNKRTLADLMNNDFFIDFDTQPKRRGLNESVNKNDEPDNAVVDCKVNKVIAHSEDEKPVDCLGEKEPLEKPLTEEASEIIYLSHALREEIAIRACDLDKIKQLDLEACKIYEDAYDAGLVDGAREERKLCRQYGVKTFNRAELFDVLTKDAKVDWDVIEWTYQK